MNLKKNINFYMIKAICENNIVKVQEFRNNGIQWPSESYFFCFLHRNYNMANFLLANRCKFDKSLFTKCLSLNDIEVLEWLKRNNCPWNKTTYKNALRYYPECEDWLKANGCPIYVPI